MRFFELDIDESQLRRLVKAVIDKYESGLREHGSYQKAVEFAQDDTIQSMENAAEFVGELIDHTGTMH